MVKNSAWVSRFFFLLWSFYETPFCTTIEVFFYARMTLEKKSEVLIHFYRLMICIFDWFLFEFFEYDKTWNFFFQVKKFFFVKIAVKRKNALGRTARICIWFFNNFGIYTCINHLKKSRKPQETTENFVLSSKIINKIFKSENKNCLKQRFFFLCHCILEMVMDDQKLTKYNRVKQGKSRFFIEQVRMVFLSCEKWVFVKVT